MLGEARHPRKIRSIFFWLPKMSEDEHCRVETLLLSVWPNVGAYFGSLPLNGPIAGSRQRCCWFGSPGAARSAPLL